MSKYYLHDGQNQLGPFDKSELKERKITVETPIWFEGLTDWTTAGEVVELKELFILAPPPFKKTEPILVTTIENQKPPSIPISQKEDNKISETYKKKNKFGILHYIVIGCVLLVGVISFVF